MTSKQYQEPYQYGAACYQQNQQALSYQEQQKQEQALIQYYIYEDLQNLINLIYSRKVVLEYFKDQPDHEMVTLCNNKLILQLNLSSSIHFDQTQQYSNNRELLSFLKKQREDAYKILDRFIGNNDQKQNKNNMENKNNEQRIQDYLQQYKDKYKSQQLNLNQFQQFQTNLQPNFNEKVLSRVISSIQNVDSKVDQIRNMKQYYIPSSQDIEDKAQQYQKMTKEKLNQNFQNYQSQNNEMENSQFNNSKVTNIGQTSNGNYDKQKSQSVIQPNHVQQPSLQNQQKNQFCLKDQLIEFLNYLRQLNVEIPIVKQYNNDKTKQAFNIKNQLDLKYRQWVIKDDLLLQLTNLHYYFYLFVEYKRLIQDNKTAFSPSIKTDIEFLNTLMDKEKNKIISISQLLEYLFNQKDQVEIKDYLKHMADLLYPTSKANPKYNQEQEQELIFKLYNLFYSQMYNNKPQQSEKKR